MAKKLSDEEEDARALLARCRHVLTGREIAICEELIDEAARWGGDDWDYFQTCNGTEFGSLQLQFSREIAEWKNAGVAA